MTQILQVGDIVRVNRPTPEGWGIVMHPMFLANPVRCV